MGSEWRFGLHAMVLHVLMDDGDGDGGFGFGFGFGFNTYWEDIYGT